MANPFDENDRSNKPRNGFDNVKSYSSNGTIEDDVDYYEKEIERYMQESLGSTQRSKQHLESSEQLGIKTAQDLLAQREQLERTEKNLDDIHRTTQMTQRSLNSLKSVFGGFFKNKFSRAPKDPPAETNIPISQSDNKLNKTLDSISENPALSSSNSGPTLSEKSRTAIKGTRWEAMDNEIDENLDAMSSQLARLKNLGSALGSEVEDQNSMLDRIQTKADRNDTVVRHQDHQMKKLLGYKGAAPPEDTAAFSGKKK
uniref:t-SNARE coiled-coil homology domain-containing protein n=1 Tax=Acrobeloides nanus TaxID=290746 RepID=A0A914CUW1_9BILA